jgi:predicted Zn-dependent protease
MTQVGSVTQEQIAAEQVKQQQLAIQSAIAVQQRADDVAAPLLAAAVPLCSDAVTTRIGASLANVSTFKRDLAGAAWTLGFTDTLSVTGVTKGSAAQRAGLATGDKIVAINGEAVETGSGGLEDFVNRLARSESRVAITIRRGAVARTFHVARDTVCDYPVVVVKDDQLNAFSDGRRVFVTSAMLRFAAADDELATVLGHEIAHNAMHHLDAQRKNSTLAGLFGAILDIAAATQGINTGGANTRDFAALGRLAFSQDFEREADYVGLYILAAAGRPIASSANLWRRLAQESPGSITFATTHPTTAERFVRLEQWQNEIGGKLATGRPLRLAMKNGSESPALTVVRAPATDATVVASARSDSATSARTGATATNSLTRPADAAMRPRSAQRSPPQLASPPPAQRAGSRLPESDDRVAVAIVGAAQSDSAEAAATQVFADGKVYFARREWGKAEELFKRAVKLDGAVAEYHAALAEVELALEKWAEAEAEYTAASMIDVMNDAYRRGILKTRQHKP